MIGYTITGGDLPNKVLARQEANRSGHRFKLGCVMTTMGVQVWEGDLGEVRSRPEYGGP